MATEIQLQNSIKKTCNGCGHVKICAVFRAVAPLLSKNWDDDTRPFEPENLALICREFVSGAIMTILKGE